MKTSVNSLRRHADVTQVHPYGSGTLTRLRNDASESIRLRPKGYKEQKAPALRLGEGHRGSSQIVDELLSFDADKIS